MFIKFMVSIISKLPGLLNNLSAFNKVTGDEIDIRFTWGRISKSSWAHNCSIILYRSVGNRLPSTDTNKPTATLTICILGWCFEYYINLKKLHKNNCWGEETNAYGIALFPFGKTRTVVIHIGEDSIYVPMPWQYIQIDAGTEIARLSEPYYDKISNKIVPSTVIVKYQVERWLWLTKLGLFSKITNTMEIGFDEPVGNTQYTHKGGILSVSGIIRNGESLIECYNRLTKCGRL